MLYTEILKDGRRHTYSDAFKIRQLETGVVYDDAVDTVEHTYEETDIPLEDVEISGAEFRAMVAWGASDAYNKGDIVSYHEQLFISNIDNNVWAPDVYGWSTYEEG